MSNYAHNFRFEKRNLFLKYTSLLYCHLIEEFISVYGVNTIISSYMKPFYYV